MCCPPIVPTDNDAHIADYPKHSRPYTCPGVVVQPPLAGPGGGVGTWRGGMIAIP